MTEPLFRSQRTFRIWLYTVSHSTLLLRSVKEQGAPTRVDVVFKPVNQILMPTTLHGIELVEVSAADIRSKLPDSFTPSRPNERLFGLAGAKGDAWVLAGSVAWHEDAGEDFGPSHFGVPRMVWE